MAWMEEGGNGRWSVYWGYAIGGTSVLGVS
jgi:hypothetical protein